MNLSQLRRMAKDGDLSQDALRYLIECHGECEHLDFKLKLDIDNPRSVIGIVKDIIAMKNTGGGYIVFGVEDKTWKVIGATQDTRIDTKFFRDKIQMYAGVDVDFDYVGHPIYINGTSMYIPFICVRGVKDLSKLKIPTQCHISSLQNEKWGIRKGETYIRDGDETVLLDDQAKFIDKIEDLQEKYLEAEQKAENERLSPFEVSIGFYRLLPREFGAFIGREELLTRIKTCIESDPRIWIINLHGPGGVGKSALASRIAYEYFESSRFDAIIHLSAKDRELSTESGIRSLTPSLISLEDFLNRVLETFSFGDYIHESLEEKKKLVTDLISDYSTLIILDNMETVTDGRIMDFIRFLPVTSQAKVLLTSRQRSADWEYPIQVSEFSYDECRQFLKVRASELEIDFPYEKDDVVKKVTGISGGLPLAIQWILGSYAITRDINTILSQVISSDSPLLEFSFRNSWQNLGLEAQQALTVLPIFSTPPTLNEWRTVLNWSIEKIERAKIKLVESTFVTERTDKKTNNTIYIALPITLSFARLELEKSGSWGQEAMTRHKTYNEKICFAQELEAQSEYLFTRFDARTPNQRKAILLTKQAEGQMATMGIAEAEEYYKRALDIDPLSVYALVSYGTFKAELSEFTDSIRLFTRAVQNLTNKTAFYIYYHFADIYAKMKNYDKQVKYLTEALKTQDLTDRHLVIMAKHSLGVALGRLQRHNEAIRLFDEIIEGELNGIGCPSRSLVIAARTKKISLSRIHGNGQNGFLDQLVERCKKLDAPEAIIRELIQIRDEN